MWETSLLLNNCRSHTQNRLNPSPYHKQEKMYTKFKGSPQVLIMYHNFILTWYAFYFYSYHSCKAFSIGNHYEFMVRNPFLEVTFLLQFKLNGTTEHGRKKGKDLDSSRVYVPMLFLCKWSFNGAKPQLAAEKNSLFKRLLSAFKEQVRQENS